MLKLPARYLEDFRVEADNTINHSEFDKIKSTLNLSKDLELTGARIYHKGKASYIAIIHICISPNEKKENSYEFHLVINIDKTKEMSILKDEMTNRFDELITFLLENNTLYNIKGTMLCTYSSKTSKNALDLPKPLKTKGMKLHLAGSIFSDEADPDSSYYMEVRNKYLRIGRMFLERNFDFTWANVNSIIEDNMKKIARFREGVK